MVDFIGNRAIYKLLNESLKKGTLAHAYIFTGPDGIGKKLLALHLAKSINCLSAKDGLSFCNKCVSCEKIESGSHPDVQLIKPDGKVFKIGQVREIIRDIYYLPFEGNKRVFILEDAHTMNEEAANSLLKTLEEPPASSMLILLTNNLYALLPTVRSGSQVLKFNPIPENEIERYLVEKQNVEPEKARKAAHLAEGSLGTAITFDDELFHEGQKWAVVVLQSMVSSDDSALFNQIKEAVKDEKKFEFYVKILVSLLRDLSIIGIFEDEKRILHKELLAELYDLRKRISEKEIQSIFSDIEDLYMKKTLNLKLDLVLQNIILKHRVQILREVI